MNLTKKHIIKRKHHLYDECKSVCSRSKDIYNATLYIARQHYFNHKTYIGFNALYHSAKLHQSCNELPKKVCNAVFRLVDRNYKSFFQCIKSDKVKKSSIPKYLDKDGMQMAEYEKGAISKKDFKNGFIKLSQSEIRISTDLKDWDSLKCVRVVPRIGYFQIEIVYEVENVKIDKRM